MSISERLIHRKEDPAAPSQTQVVEDPVSAGVQSALDTVLVDVKDKIHQLAVDKMDIQAMNASGEQAKVLREQLRPAIVQMALNQLPAYLRLTTQQQQLVIERVLDELFGYGPLQVLLDDPDISDVLVNHASQVYIEKKGKLELSKVRFDSNQHLLNIIQRIVSRNGRRVDESSPMVDARLPDGSRVNAVVPPIAADGPILSIRRFGTRSLGPEHLIQRGVGTKEMIEYLDCIVKAKSNLLVSGGTGAGKTTLLNVLSGLIPGYERVITIEDSAELSLQGQHVVRMEARPANVEGKGEVNIRACVKNALRMRPDRVVIGEVRGAEVLDMLQAMNTGHEGSMATIHANTPREAVDRVMMMLALSGVVLPQDSMIKFVVNTLRVIVQVARFADGTRRITHLAEVHSNACADGTYVHNVFSWSVQKNRFVYHGGSIMDERFEEHHVRMNWPAPQPPSSRPT
jgi:pilus assembly protein CpaF